MPVTSQLTQPATFGDLPGERQRGGDDAGADRAVRPQPDADRRGADEQQRVHRREREHEARDDAHVRAHRVLVLVDRLRARTRPRRASAREQLDREDVGVAVDHARHDERAHLRARLRAGRACAARSSAGRRRSRRTTAASAAPRRQSASAISTSARDAVDARCTRPRGCSPSRSRAARCAVCITRLAMRPAKSFWKNGQLWRTTCQWLCQRIRLVAPGMSALWRIATSASSDERPHEQHQRDHAGEHRPLRAERRLPVGRFHQRHQPADEERDHRVEQRHREAGGEHGRVPALRLPHEVPVEGDQPLRRRAWPGLAVPRIPWNSFKTFFLPCGSVRCNDPAALIVDT